MESVDLTCITGNLEKWHALRHHLRHYTSIGLTATYRLPPAEGRSLKDDIYRACEVVIQHHPSLSANVIFEEINKPYFVRLPEIDLDKCISFQRWQPESSESGDAELDELFQKYHNSFFDSGAPLWKLCVLENPSTPETFTATFVYNHGIGDGTSGKVFHATFAQALDQVLQAPPQSDANSILTPPTDPLPAMLEDELDLPLSAWFIVKELYRSKFPSRKDSVWTGAPVNKTQKAPVNRVKHVVVPEQTTTKLRKTCSANGTTITAFLQILVARLLFKLVDTKFTRIIFQGSISPRKWMNNPSSENLIGDWVLDYSEEYLRNALEGEAFPWHQTKAAKKSLSDKVAMKGKNKFVGLLRFVSNPEEEVWKPRLGKPRNDSFEISNLGAFKTNNSSAVSIERMIFSQSTCDDGTPVVLSTITGGDGCLTLTYSWQDSVVEASFVESLITRVEQEISRLSS
jgi:Alcohol acetyltransferase